jgi:hypothetical protein
MAVDCGCALGTGFRGGGAVSGDFGKTVHGTPAPMAPPQRLVVVGPYRYAVLCGLGRAVGDPLAGERGRDCVRVCGGGSVCGASRAADAAKDVRRGL